MSNPAQTLASHLASLDAKWLTRWKSMTKNGSLNPRRLVKPTHDKKIYSFAMFPYPSGNLHMGHVRVYAISDVLSRYYRMKGYDVIHPMGWDAFGLPAENAAVERGVSPDEWTKLNIKNMKNQMEYLMADFDWDKEVTTCNPDYYKWTQKIFLLMYENGLAYRKKAEINWDPIDNTVLANEQVDDKGRSWRSGAIVEKRLLEQWFLGITKFAKELNKDLDLLDEWPSKVKAMQRNWIGESKGGEIKFDIKLNDDRVKLDKDTIDVFTTRAETIYSVQYVALSFDHPIVQQYVKFDQGLNKFIEFENHQKQKMTEFGENTSKAGYLLGNISVVNPLDSKISNLPIFVAPYVIGGYGHGAVMGCPGHDERDYDFWLDNMGNNSNIIKTVEPKVKELDKPFDESKPFLSKNGVMNSNARELSGMDSNDAREKVIKSLTDIGKGSSKIQYKLRDWLISRQRFWGAPIPIIHCEDCGPVAVPDEDLPVLLPKVDKLLGRGGSPLASMPEFIDCKCPKCHKDAKRDSDTMDTFMDSSWYMFRYLDSKNTKEIFNKDIINKYMPVDQYIGGIEHAILHLLYTRFISKFLGSIGYWSNKEMNCEPIRRLVSQGMVHGKTFIDPDTGKFLKPDEYEIIDNGNSAIVKSSGVKANISFEKMSKSKYNGVEPTEFIKRHGSDSTRAHILFQAPITDILDWDESKIVGIHRWLRKILRISDFLQNEIKDSKEFNELNSIDTNIDYSKCNDSEIEFLTDIQNNIKLIEESYEKTLLLNVIISEYIKFTNRLFDEIDINNLKFKENSKISLKIFYKSYIKLLKMISPVVPTVAEESNEMLHLKFNNNNNNDELNSNYDSILASEWPGHEVIKTDNVSYNIMINGKMRFVHKSNKQLIEDGESKCIEELINTKDGKKWIGDKEIKKVIMKPKAIVIITSK